MSQTIPSHDHPLTLVPHTSVQSHSSQHAAMIIRAMLDGTLDTHQMPDIGPLNGHGAMIVQLFEGYRYGGQTKAWEMMGVLVHADPNLAEQVLSIPSLPLPTNDAPFRIYTAQEYMQRPPVKYLDNEKTIQERGITMVFGEPAKGKSLWVKRKAARIADKLPILMVVAEGQNGTPDRLRAESQARGEPISNNFHIVDVPIDLRDQAAITNFIAIIKNADIRPNLVIFDTLSACAPGTDENSSKDISLIMVSCKRICLELDAAVLLVMHTTKDGASYRGHSMLHGTADIMLEVKNTKGIVTVTGFKSKDGPLTQIEAYRIQAYVTRQSEKGEEITGAALVPTETAQPAQKPAKPKLKPNKRKVLEALADHELGLQHSEIMDVTGIARSSLNDVLPDLLAAGYVVHNQSRDPYVITETGKAILQAELS